MKSALVALLGILLLAPQICGAEDKAPTTQKEKVSYTIGINIGRNMKQQSVDVDPEILVRGLKDGLTGAKTALSDEEMAAAMGILKAEMTAKLAEQTKQMAEKNKKEGEAFLAENKKKEGVKTTASGLQYKILKEGTGPLPKKTDTVKVNYKGTFIDGVEFDSSYRTGEPVSFPIDGVIPAWTEALPLMKTGSKWLLFVPSSLAYGEQGAESIIEPNKTLIFEVELISIEPAKKEKDGAKKDAAPAKQEKAAEKQPKKENKK